MDQVPWWISLSVSWLPFIALIGVWIYLSRNMQNRGWLDEMQRTNTLLERIATALEKRP